MTSETSRDEKTRRNYVERQDQRTWETRGTEMTKRDYRHVKIVRLEH